MRNVALLGTRLVVGSYLAVHGAQKLFGTFGGPRPGQGRGGLRPDRPAAGRTWPSRPGSASSAAAC